jgi:hypothetical protein
VQYWRYQDPDGEYVMSEDQILAEYFEWWSVGMRRIGKAEQINHRNCIEDWAVVHWACKCNPPDPTSST